MEAITSLLNNKKSRKHKFSSGVTSIAANPLADMLRNYAANNIIPVE